MKRDRQASFAGGEIDPALHGRTDTPRYFNSVKRSRNILITPQGRAVNRPGAQFVGYSGKLAGGALSTKTRMIPFIFGGDQSYAILLSDSVIHIVRKGRFLDAYAAGPPPAFGASAVEGDILKIAAAAEAQCSRCYVASTVINPSGAGVPTWSGATTYALGDHVTAGTPYTTSEGIDFGKVIYRSLQAANLNHLPSAPGVLGVWWEVVWHPLPYDTNPLSTLVAHSNNTIQIHGSPYLEADLSRLKAAQSGDTIVITCKGHPVREFKRYSATRWVLSAYRTAPLQAAPTAVTLGASIAADATHPAKNWSIVVTAISADGSEESKASTALTPGGGLAVYAPDRPATYTWTAPAGTAPSGYFIYRGQGGVFGYIGQVGVGTLTFRDDGQDPDYQLQPPTGRNPFDVVPSVDPNRNPQVVTFHQQREVFANSPNLPATQWHTRLGQLHSFDRALPSNTADAFDFTLASRRFEEIRWMLSVRSLCIGTSEGEWTADGVQQEPPNPNSIDTQRHSDWGSSWVDPVLVGDTVLYLTNKESHLREFIELRTFPPQIGRDLSLVAQHLFQGHSIVDMTFTRTPLLAVWLVRDDGVLLSLTYNKEAQQVAWGWHDTDGTVENVLAVPEGNNDVLYLSVKRTDRSSDNSRRHIERLTSRALGDRSAFLGVYEGASSVEANDLQNLHSVMRPNYWMHHTVDPASTVLLDDTMYVDGRRISPTTMGVGSWGFTISGSGTGTLTLVATNAIFDQSWVGAILTSADGSINVATISVVTDATHATATEILVGGASNGGPTSNYGLKRKKVLNSKHLPATVTVVADGQILTLTEDGGGYLTLPTPALKIVVGRSYTQQFGLLPYAHERAEMKTVARTLVEMIDSDPRGLSAGQDYTDLKPLALESGQVIDPTTGTFARITSPINFNSKFDRHGEAVLQQTDPRPVEIIGIIRELNP